MLSTLLFRIFWLYACFFVLSASANKFEASHAIEKKHTSGLSENIRISSENLHYDLQYRVYLPPKEYQHKPLPVIYLTDGQHYIHSGGLVNILERLVNNQSISPVIAVFIDPRDPDNLSVNRRNEQFFCNTQYIDFVNKELMSVIDTTYNTLANAQHRLLWGLSFGGLNAACFGLLSHHTFRNFAIQSPAMHPIPNIRKAYEDNPPPPLNIYLSTGTINDAEEATRKFKRILKSTGHQVKFKSTQQGHNWRNWRPMLDNILVHFYGKA